MCCFSTAIKGLSRLLARLVVCANGVETFFKKEGDLAKNWGGGASPKKRAAGKIGEGERTAGKNCRGGKIGGGDLIKEIWEEDFLKKEGDLAKNWGGMFFKFW